MNWLGFEGRKPRVLLLNPPGERVYLRDYFCSKVSQADYLHHPVDLLALSGALRESADLEAVDAIARGLTVEATLARVENFRPDVVIGLIGSVSLPEDKPFYARLRTRCAAKLVLIGDILVENRRGWMRRFPFADALLHDFAGEDALAWLTGGPDLPGLLNLTVRGENGVRVCPIRRRRGRWKAATPLHELFQGQGYRNPFLRSGRFATVLTELGCPYRCEFCVMSTLGWRVREASDVLEELDYLRALGVDEIFFLDQTFGIDAPRAFHLLEEMRSRRHGFGWICFSRPDLVGDELLTAMRRAGCHTVILGLESGSDEILQAARKDYRTDQIREGFRACKRNGLRTVATVILGLPEETESTFRRTMELLRDVDPDFASFNVAVPRMGTPLRKRALALGLIGSELEVMDQSGTPATMPTLTLSRSQVERLRGRALDGFYFNPAYLGKRLRAAAARPGDLGRQFRQGLSLLRRRLTRTF